MELFAVTHKSIRMLLRKANREPDKRLISDGALLVREQIEKLFVCVLVLDNPTKWMNQYMRNALKNDLVEYLVELAEHSETPRLNDLLNNQLGSTRSSIWLKCKTSLHLNRSKRRNRFSLLRP